MSSPTSPQDSTVTVAQSVLWLTKLRSTLDRVDHEQQVDHCLKRGIVGIGWEVGELAAGASLAEVTTAIRDRPEDGWGRRAAATVWRLGDTAKDGEFVWVRDTHGAYRLGQFDGPYRYEDDPAAWAVDVHQVRDVNWAPKPLNDLEVPGGVIRAFIGPGLSFFCIHDQGAQQLTPYLWELLHDRPLPALYISPRDVVTTYLDPYDVEDLVYLWMQVEADYIVLPRARARGTPAYEWTAIHRPSSKRAIVQIKTGTQALDPQDLADAVTDPDMKTYAFAASEDYGAHPEAVDEIITVDELVKFAVSHQDLLADRTRYWFELAR